VVVQFVGDVLDLLLSGSLSTSRVCNFPFREAGFDPKLFPVSFIAIKILYHPAPYKPIAESIPHTAASFVLNYLPYLVMSNLSVGGSSLDWVHEGSALLQEVVELSVFVAGAGLSSNSSGFSGNSQQNVCDFFKGELFSRRQSSLFLFNLSPESTNEYLTYSQ